MIRSNDFRKGEESRYRYLDVKSGSPLSQAMAGVVWGFNSPEMKRGAVYAAKWKAWVDKLAEDADAPLELD